LGSTTFISLTNPALLTILVTSSQICFGGKALKRLNINSALFISLAVTGSILLIWDISLHEDYRALGWERYRGVDIDIPEQIFGLLLGASGILSLFLTFQNYRHFKTRSWGLERSICTLLICLSAATLALGATLVSMGGSISLRESLSLWLALSILMVILSILSQRLNRTQSDIPQNQADAGATSSAAAETKQKIKKLKSRYTVFTGAGAFALLLGLFCIPIAGGFSGSLDNLQLYFNSATTQATLSPQFKEQTFTQTGTGVTFTKYDISYSFTVNGQRFTGDATIDQSPNFVREVIVYYYPAHPALHSVRKIGNADVILLIGLWLPLPVSLILLLWGGVTFRKFKAMGGR